MCFRVDSERSVWILLCELVWISKRLDVALGQRFLLDRKSPSMV